MISIGHKHARKPSDLTSALSVSRRCTPQWWIAALPTARLKVDRGGINLTLRNWASVASKWVYAITF